LTSLDVAGSILARGAACCRPAVDVNPPTIINKSPWHTWIRLHANPLTSYFGNRSNYIIGIESPFPLTMLESSNAEFITINNTEMGGRGAN